MERRLPEHSEFSEWLYLELDGELGGRERARLREHLASCAPCREEREQVLALQRLLADSRIPVHPDFRREVLAGLPTAGWEARLRRGWWLAAAVAVSLLVGAALLVGVGSSGVAVAAPLAALAALWDLMATSALAGAGLLTASWTGLGIAIQDLLGRSVWNLIAFGVIVVALDLLLLRLLLRRRAAAPPIRRARQNERE